MILPPTILWIYLVSHISLYSPVMFPIDFRHTQISADAPADKALYAMAPLFAVTIINSRMIQRRFIQTGEYQFSTYMYSQELVEQRYNNTPETQELMQVPLFKSWIMACSITLEVEWSRHNLRNNTVQEGTVEGLLSGGLTALTGCPAREAVPTSVEDLCE